MDTKQVENISQILGELARQIASLDEAGKGIPAVECNVLRLRGTLRQLQVQFEDLNAVAGS